MTLNKINEAEVWSTEGFKVKYGRDALSYVEPDRYLLLAIEHLYDPHELVVYLNEYNQWFKKGSPVGVINENDLHIVSKRIEECLALLGGNYSIQCK